MIERKSCVICKKPDGQEDHECMQWLIDEVKRLEKYRPLFKAAKKYIDESPCDPDIYPQQLEAWNTYQSLMNRAGIKP